MTKTLYPDRETITVWVTLKTSNQPGKFKACYCVFETGNYTHLQMADGTVYSFPTANIFRLKTKPE